MAEEQLSDGEMTASHDMVLQSLNFPLLHFVDSHVRFKRAL